MEKILLIGINARYSHSNLAIRYLKNYKNFTNTNIKILEFSINMKSKEIIKSILIENSTAIFFSVYIWNSEIVKILLSQLADTKSTGKIILGGPEVSYNHNEWISQFKNIDFIIKGPGEESFAYLIENKFSVEKKIISELNPPFREITFPYLNDDFHLLKNKFIYYESTRGCPFKCTYCLSSREDQKVEYRELNKVKKELDYIIEKKPGTIKFVDRTFNLKKDHYRDIWKHLIEKHSYCGVKFHFEIFPEFLDENDFNILKNLPKNFFQFEMGIQSLNEKTLNSINRKCNWKKTKENILRLKEMGNIHLLVDLIAGLPYEDMKSFIKSFNTLYSLKADNFQLGFLKILPGTELSQRISEYSIIHSKFPPYEVESTKWLGGDEIKILKEIEKSLETFYNSGHFSVTIKHLEELNKNYFHLYDTLRKYKPIDKNYYNRWEQDGEILLKYIEDLFPEKKSFFIDCLRWDWIHYAKISNYIPLLKSDFTQTIRRKSLNFLMNFSEKGIIDFDGEKFSQNDLKRSIFFKAESVDFNDRYIEDSAIICILPDKREIFISNY